MPSPRPPAPSQSERLQLEVRILTSELEAASALPADEEREAGSEAPSVPPSDAPAQTDNERASD